LVKLQLTIDDGPQPVRGALEPILNEIDRWSVKAAFFVLGEEVVNSHSSIAEIRKRGHVIGNHSWDHLKDGTAKYSSEQIYEQFMRTHNEVKSAGYNMIYWRAPRGELISTIMRILVTERRLYSFSHCDWHADSRDALGAKLLVDMIRFIENDLKRLKDDTKSYRLLFHVKPTTASALKKILDYLTSKGHTIVDFSQSK